MKIIVTIIPTDLVAKLSSFYHFLHIRNKNFVFSKLVVYSNEKYFCFLFIASCALLESHAKCNRLLLRNFLTCYSCSYYSSMLKHFSSNFQADRRASNLLRRYNQQSERSSSKEIRKLLYFDLLA